MSHMVRLEGKESASLLRTGILRDSLEKAAHGRMQVNIYCKVSDTFATLRMKFPVHEYIGHMLHPIPSSGYKRSGWKSSGRVWEKRHRLWWVTNA